MLPTSGVSILDSTRESSANSSHERVAELDEPYRLHRRANSLRGLDLRHDPVDVSPRLREGAIRMVRAHEAEHPSHWAAVVSIAGKLGCTAETLRNVGTAGRARCGRARWPDDRRGGPAMTESTDTATFDRVVRIKSAFQAARWAKAPVGRSVSTLWSEPAVSRHFRPTRDQPSRARPGRDSWKFTIDYLLVGRSAAQGPSSPFGLVPACVGSPCGRLWRGRRVSVGVPAASAMSVFWP